jgi:hypothetical protein
MVYTFWVGLDFSGAKGWSSDQAILRELWDVSATMRMKTGWAPAMAKRYLSESILMGLGMASLPIDHS